LYNCYNTNTRKGINGYFRCHKCDFKVYPHCCGSVAFHTAESTFSHHYISHIFPTRPVMSLPNLPIPSGLNFYRLVSEEEAKTHQREYFCTRIYKYSKKTALPSIQCTLCPFVLNKDPIWNVELAGIEIAKRMRDRMEAHYKIVHKQEELPNELKFFHPMRQKELI
jgi:hypothetical protein